MIGRLTLRGGRAILEQQQLFRVHCLSITFLCVRSLLVWISPLGCCQFTMSSLVRHIPEWLPWFSYKPLARFGHDLGLEVVNSPIQFVKDAMVSRS
jgi:hypothetical protein